MTDLRKAAEDLMPILDKWKMTYPPCSGADWDKVEALRQALAQSEQECIYPKCETAGGCDGPCGSAVEQEPVAWHEPGAYGNVTTHKDWALANGWEPLYTAPPKREWVGLTDEEMRELEKQFNAVTLPLENVSLTQGEEHMTDRELLEYAAKATGIMLWQSPEGFRHIKDGVAKHIWNPLNDDGQALQLAVKLRLMISCHESEKVIVIWWRDGIRGEIVLAHDNKNGNDPYAATRRAIVRAAAEIGKEKNT